LGRFYMRIYRCILSLGAFLHAHLPLYPFPWDLFACVFTLSPFPGDYFACVFTLSPFPGDCFACVFTLSPFPGDCFACVFTAISFPWGVFCMRIYAVSFPWGLFCMRIYAVSFHWGWAPSSILHAYLRCLLSLGMGSFEHFACVFTLSPFPGGLICMRIYAVSFPWGWAPSSILHAYLRCLLSLGTNLHAYLRCLLSLGTILHAHLPWYPFPGDFFACVFTVVSCPVLFFV